MNNFAAIKLAKQELEKDGWNISACLLQLALNNIIMEKYIINANGNHYVIWIQASEGDYDIFKWCGTTKLAD
jgi:hypothetical protein